MLSFMREEGLGEPLGQKPLGPPPIDGTAPDGTGDLKRNEVQGPNQETQEQGHPQTQKNVSGAQQEYLTVAARNRNVRRSTILLASLFILGLLCLFFMIKKSSPQTAKASSGQGRTEEAQIETAITRLIGVRSEIFNRMGEIVKKFYEFSDVQQVKVDELAKNPFKLEIFMGDLKEKSDTEFGINAKMLRQEQLKKQTKNMQLLSIMATDTSEYCMIDDRILHEGDSIRGFNVHRIGDSTVTLESDGMEVILKLSE